MQHILAQFSNEQDPTGVLNNIWPIMAILVPFITARITHKEAASLVKFGMALVMAILAGVLSLIGYDFSTLGAVDGIQLFFERVAAVFGTAQTVFFVVDKSMSGGLNSSKVMAPDSGIRGPRSSGPQKLEL